MTTRSIVLVTNDTPRVEIAEALTNLARRASREFPVVGSEENPTPWDLRHDAINVLLYDWQAAS